MFLVVGATVLAMLGRFSPSPDGDEGTAEPWDVAKRLAVPAAALVVAFSTLYYMEHVR